MQSIQHHFTRCLIAGIVAIMPLGGVVATVVYLEKQLAVSWLKAQGFYFYGLGMLAARMVDPSPHNAVLLLDRILRSMIDATLPATRSSPWRLRSEAPRHNNRSTTSFARWSSKEKVIGCNRKTCLAIPTGAARC